MSFLSCQIINHKGIVATALDSAHQRTRILWMKRIYFQKWNLPELAGNIRWGYRAPMLRLTTGEEEAYEKERECDLA